MWWVLGLVSLVIVTWVLLSIREILYPERRLLSPPDPLPGYTTHLLRSSDGSSFDVWCLEASSPKGRLLIFHGYFMNRFQVLGIAQGLRERGYEVLLFELRGHGSRPGPYTFGLKETEDARSVLHWTLGRAGARPLPLGLLGLSTGAAVACEVARRLPEVRTVVTDSVYPRFYPIVRRSVWRRYHLPAFPFAWITWWGLQCLLRGRLASLDPAAIARQLHQPLLAIYGGQDQVVFPSESEEFYHAWSGPKERWVDPDVAHVGMFAKDPEAYFNRVAAFFNRVLSVVK